MGLTVEHLEDIGEEYPLLYRLPPETSHPATTKKSIFKEIIDSSSSDSPARFIPEYLKLQTHACVVIRGGFPLIEQDTVFSQYTDWREYPPAPGTAYKLAVEKKPTQEVNPNTYKPQHAFGDNDGNKDDRQHWEDSTNCFDSDSTTKVGAAGSERDEGMDEDHLNGDRVADTIDFNRQTSLEYTPGVSGLIMTAAELREDFIANINSGAAFEFCSKCKQNHIPPGSPITLQDRDTCFSYLPEWFPTDGRINKPWESFTAMMNEKILMDEVTQGYNHKCNPDQKVWDLEFHDSHPKWREAGRKSGWWKCGSGPNAPEVERNCYICHHPSKAQEMAVIVAKKDKSLARHRADVVEFIENRMHAIGEQDKAIVLERIRIEGWPQHLGVTNNDLPSHILVPVLGLEIPPQDYFQSSFSSDYPADSKSTTPTEHTCKDRPILNSY